MYGTLPDIPLSGGAGKREKQISPTPGDNTNKGRKCAIV